MWSLDINSYQWTFINTTKFNLTESPPPPREQHSAAFLNGNLYVFGGKSRLHPADSLGFPILSNMSDTVYDDFWMLEIEHPVTKTYKTNVNGRIQQDIKLTSTVSPSLGDFGESSNIPRESKCIQDVTVKV